MKCGERMEITISYKDSSKRDNINVNGVYCDNERLKEDIVKYKPLIQGLYMHEVVCLYFSKMYYYNTKKCRFPSLLYNEYFVDNPELLLESLINKGFLKKCEYDDIEKCFYSRTMIRDLIKENQLDSYSGKQNKEELFNWLRENFSKEEILEITGLFYIPTEKGEEILNEYQKICQNEQKEKRIPEKFFSKYIKRKLIKRYEYNPGVQYVDINSKTKIYYSGSSDILKEKEGFNNRANHRKPVTIFLSVDKKYVGKIENVNEIYMLSNSSVVVCVNNQPKFKKVLFYDYIENKVVHCETLKENISLLISHVLISKTLEYTPDVENDTKSYYVHFLQELAPIIFEQTCVKNSVKIEKISNTYIFGENNYKVTIKKDDLYTRTIFHQMCVNGVIGVLQNDGIPFYVILANLYAKMNNCKAICLFLEDEGKYENEDVVTKKIMKIAGDSFEKFVGKIEKVVPSKFLFCSDLARLSEIDWKDRCNDKEYKDANWKMIAQRNYKDLLMQLKNDGIIKSRWLNEFNLYLLIKKIYKDAEYQYRSTWLGRQSLDIYIPSLNIGIEYQGKQHYESVEFFGGEEGLEERIKLDEKKKKLCKDNKVTLLEWPYTLDVSSDNVKKFIEENF